MNSGMTRRDVTTAAYSSVQLAIADFSEALSQAPFWLKLGWKDIQMRYRGSILGPFWMTLTTLVFIIGLGPLYGALFGLNNRQYLPYLAIGLIVWNFITTTLNEACRTFSDAGPIMKQVRLPRMWHIFHMLWRNCIAFAHNFPIVLGVVWYGGIDLNVSAVAVIPGFMLLMLILLSLSVLLAILCARYADMTQIVTSILSIGFFLTPVMWNPALQRVNSWVVWLNPFAAMVDLIRAPLLHQPPTGPLIVNALLTAFILTLLASIAFVRYRKHIVYWV